MLAPPPSVSVCIPTYNGGRYLAETVRSVLDQTYRDFELVILDNASTDDTLDVARSFRDPRIRIERNGSVLPQMANWDRAVELCRAPLVKLTCDDDLLHPRCLEYQVPPMEADPGLALAVSRRHLIDEKSRVIVPRRGLSGLIGERSGVDVARTVVRSGQNPLGHPGGALFRLEQFRAIGGWRADRNLIGDLDLFVRLLQCGNFLGQPQALAAFRIRRGSVSADNDEAIYEQQRELLAELAASPHYQVRPIDLRIGRLTAPLGRLRRKTLFAASRLTNRRDRAGAGAAA